jgi:hypothetical protein
VLDVPNILDTLTISPLEAVGHWPNDLFDYEWAFPRCEDLVHVLGFLDALQDQVAAVEGSLPHVVVVVWTNRLLMAGMPHEHDHTVFFKAVEVDLECLFCRDSFRSVG